MSVRLELRQATTLPLEVEGILPREIGGKSLADIERLPILCGNRPAVVADFFRVTGDTADAFLIWSGDLSRVHWIGAGLDGGTILVEGNAGRHVGSRMRAGRIEVTGDVSDWLGGELRGGELIVRGSAGNLVGSAYRGSARGMTGGTLLVHGDVGDEIGWGMRRGLLAVAGRAGDLIGCNMRAGSILVFGACGVRHGAGMRRGTIGLLGSTCGPLLPTFRSACQGRWEFLRLVDRALRQYAFPAPRPAGDVTVTLYHGDLLEGGRGEILLPAEAT